jgi:hypothetical protein
MTAIVGTKPAAQNPEIKAHHEADAGRTNTFRPARWRPAEQNTMLEAW